MQFFIRILQLVEPPIKPAKSQEFVVRAHFAQFAVMQDDNAVTFLYCRKTVGYYKRRSLVHNAIDRTLDQLFGLRVDRTCGLVKDQDLRVECKCTGK